MMILRTSTNPSVTRFDTNNSRNRMQNNGRDIFATQANSPTTQIEKREPYMPIEMTKSGVRNMSLIATNRPSQDHGMRGSHYPLTTKEGQGKATLLPGASNTFMHNNNRDNLLAASGKGANQASAALPTMN